jgi:hypothetical protein
VRRQSGGGAAALRQAVANSGARRRLFKGVRGSGAATCVGRETGEHGGEKEEGARGGFHGRRPMRIERGRGSGMVGGRGMIREATGNGPWLRARAGGTVTRCVTHGSERGGVRYK